MIYACTDIDIWDRILHVEYVERITTHGIVLMFSPVYEHSNFEYKHVPVEYRVYGAECGTHIRVAASQEYVNTYSTCRDRMA